MVKTKQNTNKEDKSERINTCNMCERPKKISQFYKSSKKEHELNGSVLPYCKICLKKMCINKDTNIFDITKFKEMLKLIDKPFIENLYMSALQDRRETTGAYMSLLNMNDNADLTWKDSDEFKQDDNKNQTIEEKVINTTDKKNEVIFNLDELIDKWGEGYTDEEYKLFEKKYYKLIDNYGEKTSLHTEGLLTYIRFRVKEEMATAKGDVKEAKEWGALASKASQDAKLNVAQLSKNDISGGVDLVCQIFEAVETEVGVIPLLPKLIEQPYDDADMVIWSVINYGRELEDKPRIRYRDIWNFYDDMLEEYYKQQGFNEQQIKEYKEKRNNVFRDLDEVYKEPVYNDTEE